MKNTRLIQINKHNFMYYYYYCITINMILTNTDKKNLRSNYELNELSIG